MHTTIPSNDTLPSPVNLTGQLDDYTMVAMGWHEALRPARVPAEAAPEEAKQ